MARSMTGFGRAQKDTEKLFVSVELKSVNHRYFELYSRVPRTYGFLEEKIKGYLQGRVARGKVECNVTIEALDTDNVIVKVNESLARAYFKALEELEQISNDYELRNDFSASTVTRFTDVFSVHKEEADEDAIWAIVEEVLASATDNFIAMREREGLKLRDDICGRADFILEKVAYIEKRSPETVREYNEKLKNRINELLEGAGVDEQRILQEAAIYADKVAVDEETVRLRSHMEQLKAMFDEKEAIGRKMDFLVQEINRETNTIGSKAADFEINKMVVDMKAEIEKIREQVQNLE